jgi:hypothetical protein
MLDAWDVSVVGAGPADEKNGKAAKYLLLPPGFHGEGPDDTSSCALPPSTATRSSELSSPHDATRRLFVPNDTTNGFGDEDGARNV